jgi:hypothetical protein
MISINKTTVKTIPSIGVVVLGKTEREFIHSIETPSGVQPILRPLSDLTDKKISDLNLDITDEIELRETRDHHKLATHLDYRLCQVLFKNHFDAFGLIDKGLAVNINTLNQKENKNGIK